MPEKRAEVVDEADATQLMPDIYESWLEKQKSTHVHAKSGFISEWKQEEETSKEAKIDLAEEAREKAKRRKKGKIAR